MKFLYISLWILVGAGAVFALVQIADQHFDLHLAARLRNRPNILVVSVCSLRPDRIGVYNRDFKGSPRIDAWSKGSFVFTNAVAEEPWQNFGFEGAEVVNRAFLAKHGYENFRHRDAGINFFVPPTERGADEEWYWSEDAILHYKKWFDELKSALLQERPLPFYIFSHLKYMHYPYYDPVNMTEEDFKKLTPKSRELMQRYVKDPLKYDAQLPVVQILLNNFELVKKKFGVERSKKILSTAGVISEPTFTEKWRKASSYNDDVVMVREMYSLKMEKFDPLAADVLNLYFDKDLADNTIVIFTGDHGEALADHGVIGHSVNVYEEMIRYPLMVKFPGSAGGVIDQQINHQMMTKLVAGMITGDVTKDNFQDKVKELSGEFVIARNCQDNIRTVRWRSEWKYIKNLVTNRNELYNLKSDPLEKLNVIDKNADVAWKLEEYMIDHQADFKRLTKREEISRVCMNQ